MNTTTNNPLIDRFLKASQELRAEQEAVEKTIIEAGGTITPEMLLVPEETSMKYLNALISVTELARASEFIRADVLKPDSKIEANIASETIH